MCKIIVMFPFWPFCYYFDTILVDHIMKTLAELILLSAPNAPLVAARSRSYSFFKALLIFAFLRIFCISDSLAVLSKHCASSYYRDRRNNLLPKPDMVFLHPCNFLLLTQIFFFTLWSWKIPFNTTSDKTYYNLHCVLRQRSPTISGSWANN